MNNEKTPAQTVPPYPFSKSTAMPQPNITIPVDLTNPGQFFACCGLLELASRIDSNAYSWFTQTHFHIAGEASETLTHFFAATVTPGEGILEPADDEDVDKKSSIRIGPPFNFILDWWREKEDNPDTGAVDAQLKTWSAGQKVVDIFKCCVETTQSKHGKQKQNISGMRAWMKIAVESEPNDWLGKAVQIDKPKSFCFDSRLSRNNALDQGHTAGGDMAFSPAIDVLCLVGLQRFRPRTIKTWDQNVYWPWCKPLPVEIASVATLGHLPQLCLPPMEFSIIRRDSAGKYKLIGHAQPYKRSRNDE